MNILKIPVFLLLVVHSITAISQPSQMEQLVQSFYEENYQELVYIHTDKDYYLTGETIKLSVYCLNALTGQPTELSRVAYADIVDGKKNTILTARIELKNGLGSGEIYIPTSVISGYVVLRGYTRWMRNFGPETFYHTVISIINPFRKLPTLGTPVDTPPSLSFFPEGGLFMAGVSVNVVFHGKSAIGQPIDFTGEVLAQDSTVVAVFKPAYHGMGNFLFTPVEGMRYTAKMILPDGSVTYHQVPATVSSGLSMQVTKNESVFTILINEKGNNPGAPLQALAHRGTMVFDSKVNINRNALSEWTISKSTLPAGVFYISVFNDTKLISQRAVYNDPQPFQKGENIMAAASVGKREPVVLNPENIKSYISGTPLAFSVSVSAETPDFLPSSINMQHWNLLNNAIAAPYDLGAFFEGSETEVAGRINNLLVAYPNLKSGALSFQPATSRRFLPEARGMLVTGHIFDKTSGEPANGIIAYLSIPGRHTRFFASKSKRDGSLAFELNKVYGENEVVVLTDYTRDSTYRINIDNPFSGEYMDVALPEFTLSETLADWLIEKSRQMQVVNAYQKYNPSRPSITEIDSSAFYFTPDASYNLDDYTRFIVMEEVMREYIAAVNVRKNKDGFHFMTVDIEKNIVYEDNPLMLLDGIPVFDADEIIALDPLKIQRIQTVNRRFGKGIVDCQGIVNYTTYKGDLAGYTLHPDALTFRYDGVQIQMTSPEIKYTTANDINSRTPDYRNTLYWYPCVTDMDMNYITQGIYTSDADGEYEVTINAIAKDGEVTTVCGKFTVR